MKLEEYKLRINNLLKKSIETDSSLVPLSKPGEYSESVDKNNIGETALQRAIINSNDIFKLENIGGVTWLDIELPVEFGVSSRRKSLDIIGISSDKIVLCELKYDKYSINPRSKGVPKTDSPVHALHELLQYHVRIIENAIELQNRKIWHSNKKLDWDWTSCKNKDELILIVAANENYWTRWQQYHNWIGIKNEIANIKKELPDSPTIKFYTLPEPEVPFDGQAFVSEGKRYIPTLGKNVSIVWKEIIELK